MKKLTTLMARDGLDCNCRAACASCQPFGKMGHADGLFRIKLPFRHRR